MPCFFGLRVQAREMASPGRTRFVRQTMGT
jgi:hypothetical protein